MPVSLEKLNNSLIKLSIENPETKYLKIKSQFESNSIRVRDPTHPNGCVFKTKSKNENYEMELNIECEENIEYLEFESLTMNNEEEKLEKELYKLVDRIFEVISSWIDYYNRHKNILVKKTILTYKSKYLSEFYKDMLVEKFLQILFEISYIKKPNDRRDNYLYITSCLVIIKTVNYITNVFEMGFFKEDQYEEIGKKILDCF